MRHLGSIVLSIVLAPIIYILGGIGLIRLSLNSASVLSGSGTDWTDVGIGAGAIVVAGALYAILVLTKLSPLGPVLAALIYIVVQLAALFDASRVQSTFGNSVFGTPNAAEAPLTGLALLLAVPLLATIFSPRRWRGKDKPAVAGTYAPPVGQSTYAQPSMPQASVPQPAGAPGQPYQPTQPAYAAPEPMVPAQPTYGAPETAQPAYAAPEPTQAYSQPEAPTFAAPSAPDYPQPTSAQPAYPQPTSAAPAYTAPPQPAPVQSTPPQPSAPQWTAPPSGTGEPADERTSVIEPKPDGE